VVSSLNGFVAVLFAFTWMGITAPRYVMYRSIVAPEALQDPELAIEPEMPRIASDVLRQLTKQERKRQEVIIGNSFEELQFFL